MSVVLIYCNIRSGTSVCVCIFTLHFIHGTSVYRYFLSDFTKAV